MFQASIHHHREGFIQTCIFSEAKNSEKMLIRISESAEKKGDALCLVTWILGGSSVKIDFLHIWLGMLSSFFKFVIPVLLLFFLFACFKKFLVLREKRELSKSGIDQIDKMSGQVFEKYLEVLFEKLGYTVERTGSVGDYGADLVTRKDGVKTVIQAKRHKGKVGIKAVQEAVAAKGHYGCEKAMVVTNSYFTDQAKRLASSNDVVLWDRKDLALAMNLMDLSPNPSQTAQASKPVITEINMTNPTSNGSTCARCGKPVSEKVRDYCLSHEQRFGGKVYCYDHQRTSPSAK
jgi:restriction system protein